jgi:hypothetical protein
MRRFPLSNVHLAVPMLVGNLSGFSTKLKVLTYGRHSLIETEKEIGHVGHAAQ